MNPDWQQQTEHSKLNWVPLVFDSRVIVKEDKLSKTSFFVFDLMPRQDQTG